MTDEKLPMLPITFRVYNGEELLRTETLTQSIIKVGKLPSSHLRLDDEGVSRMHAVIEVSTLEEVFVIDLGSLTGTFLNGLRVTKATIRDEDELRFGAFRVVVTGLPTKGTGHSVPAAESALPLPRFSGVTETHDHETHVSMVVPAMFAGRRNRYHVLRVHLRTGKTTRIGCELDLETAQRIAQRHPADDHKKGW
jgi:pSer/pThr/pTyr-binding forkhead associated (FHA) protein